MASSTVSMKLLIDSQSKRVLFAEASKETVDFLFNILSLPMATIIGLVRKQRMVGSLGYLYESIESLNESYIQPNQTKDTLLNPMPPVGASSVPLLLVDVAITDRKFYRCNQNCSISDDPSSICPQCNRKMTILVQYVAPPGKHVSTEGGFVKGLVTYMIMDNLVVKPMSIISIIALLKHFKVEVGALEAKEVNVGMNEATLLLKAALHSEKVLSNVFPQM